MKCRHCKAPLTLKMVDLGTAPPSNAYLDRAQLDAPERWYPLRVLVCQNCWLVQTEDFAERESLFAEDYAYFSSVSSTWRDHVEAYAEMMIGRYDLNGASAVVEVACNDGCLLDAFQKRGVPVLGVEPTASTAAAARDRDIAVIEDFFCRQLAEDMIANGQQADLIVANNVLAHVPDINDFVAAFRVLAKPQGVVTFEFPHLLNLIAQNQFDTIYHEHFSYLSMTSVKRILERNGLQIFDIEEVPTHGGSLRIFAQSNETGVHVPTTAMATMVQTETMSGLCEKTTYLGFQRQAERIKNTALKFLLHARSSGKKCVGYGAAAKGNTLLNFAGIKADLIEYVADRNPTKQDLYLPGSRIPIVSHEAIADTRPDYVIVFPWNLRTEIADQLGSIRDWGGKFVVFVPDLEIF